ncbi:hypothetical protein L873DRAFT_1372400 [Choiromyces venosus 120613-1]|uniref:Uncharacterized protein n=1 Tax=Choiromyces venosus 120613-1 TaxID=1336337 RepID=A0A3N4J9U0_9PEZI|nr:hypothetical protein L873DRAFT_1372400 [Choiromyces venosus 120613-1]
MPTHELNSKPSLTPSPPPAHIIPDHPFHPLDHQNYSYHKNSNRARHIIPSRSRMHSLPRGAI